MRARALRTREADRFAPLVRARARTENRTEPRSSGLGTADFRPRLCAAMFGQPTVDAEPLGQPGGTADFRPRLCQHGGKPASRGSCSARWSGRSWFADELWTGRIAGPYPAERPPAPVCSRFGQLLRARAVPGCKRIGTVTSGVLEGVSNQGNLRTQLGCGPSRILPVSSTSLRNSRRCSTF